MRRSACGRGRHSHGFQLREDERVDRISCPVRSCCRRHFRPFHSLKRPPIAAGADGGGALIAVERSPFGPPGPGGDPRFQGLDFGLRKFLRSSLSRGRHLACNHSLEEQALVRVPRHDHFAALTATPERLIAREHEVTGCRGVVVAFQAAHDEDRRDFALEIHFAVGKCRSTNDEQCDDQSETASTPLDRAAMSPLLLRHEALPAAHPMGGSRSSVIVV